MCYIDRSGYESGEEQKSKDIRNYLDRKCDRDSRKDVRRNYKGKDKRDQRDDNSDYEKYSDSEEFHGNLDLLKLYLKMEP